MPIQSTQQSPSPHEELWVSHLGTLPYRDALVLQRELRERRVTGELPDVLLLLEHPPVYTRGRRSDPSELALGEEFYRARGIEVVQTDRGGRVTYHGPGQLVGYPIMGVSDVGVYLRTMEAALVAALADFGVEAHSRCAEGPDYRGVWVHERKIASIGVHISRGVSTHGFAVNVDNDLAPFDWIVACGLPDVRMTSLARELGPGQPHPHEPPPARALDASAFRERVAHCFCGAHRQPMRVVSPTDLGLPAARPSVRAEAPLDAAGAVASPTA